MPRHIGPLPSGHGPRGGAGGGTVQQHVDPLDFQSASSVYTPEEIAELRQQQQDKQCPTLDWEEWTSRQEAARQEVRKAARGTEGDTLDLARKIHERVIAVPSFAL